MLELGSADRTKIYPAFLEAFADYSMGPPAGLHEERLQLRMKKNAVDYDLSVGAYDEGRLVGFTLIGVDVWGGELVAYDAGTGIVPAFRGQGLASRMFDQALPALRRRGVERFVLEVLQTNEPAIRAYKKAGFEASRELRSFAAEVARIPSVTASPWDVRPIDITQFEDVAREVDWLPSFENRVSAIRCLDGDVTLFGAFDGEACVGTYAYSAPLRWFLSLVVRRSHRRRGVGRALVAHAAAHVPDGVTRITALNVDGGDVGMQEFLAQLGFAPLVDQFEMTRLVF
jgi:ribosomal protein S18 acetylase RimI-like enzyme